MLKLYFICWRWLKGVSLIVMKSFLCIHDHLLNKLMLKSYDHNGRKYKDHFSLLWLTRKRFLSHMYDPFLATLLLDIVSQCTRFHIDQNLKIFFADWGTLKLRVLSVNSLHFLLKWRSKVEGWCNYVSFSLNNRYRQEGSWKPCFQHLSATFKDFLNFIAATLLI